MKQYLIKSDDALGWSHAISKFEHSIAHTARYNQAFASSMHLPITLYVAEDDDFTLICPIAIRKAGKYKEICSPYGFSGFCYQGHCPNFSKHWHEFCEQQGYITSYIALNPFMQPPRELGFDDLNVITECYAIDLTQSLDLIRGQFSKTHRSLLKSWLAEKYQIIDDKKLLLPYLPDLYFDSLKDRKVKKVYHFAANVFELFQHDDTLILGISDGTHIVSISVFMFNSSRADYTIQATRPEYKHHTRGLIWHAIERLKEKQVTLLNLGGGITPNDTLAQFKRRFGTKTYPCYAIKSIHRKTVYEKLCADAKVSCDKSGYFPPYQISGH